MEKVDKLFWKVFLLSQLFSSSFHFLYGGLRLYKPFLTFVINCVKAFCAFSPKAKNSAVADLKASSCKNRVGMKWIRFILKNNPINSLENCKYVLSFCRGRLTPCNTYLNINNRGSTLIIVLLLMPIFVFVSFFLYSNMTVQYHKMKWVDHCREHLLSIQKTNGKFIHQILQLNPRSRFLRSQVEITQQQLLAAASLGQAHLVVTLRARLQILKTQQKYLDLYQKTILRQAKMISNLSLHRSHTDLKNLINSDKLNSLAWVKVRTQHAPTPEGHFSIKRDDQKIAPTYSPYLNFERRQSLALSWTSEYDWSLQFLNNWAPKKIKSQCRVSIKEGKWHAIVQMDRL